MRSATFLIVLLGATCALLWPSAGLAGEKGENVVPDNVIALKGKDVIIFTTGYAKMSPEERVTHFWKALVRAMNRHFKNYDRPIEEKDFSLEERWNGDIWIKLHDEPLIEVSQRDAEDHARDSVESLAKYWMGLVIRYVLKTQPANDPEVVF